MPCGLGGWRAGAGLATPGTGLLKSSGKEQSVWPLLSLMSVAQWAGLGLADVDSRPSWREPSPALCGLPFSKGEGTRSLQDLAP